MIYENVKESKPMVQLSVRAGVISRMSALAPQPNHEATFSCQSRPPHPPRLKNCDVRQLPRVQDFCHSHNLFSRLRLLYHFEEVNMKITSCEVFWTWGIY